MDNILQAIQEVDQNAKKAHRAAYDAAYEIAFSLYKADLTDHNKPAKTALVMATQAIETMPPNTHIWAKYATEDACRRAWDDAGRWVRINDPFRHLR